MSSSETGLYLSTIAIYPNCDIIWFMDTTHYSEFLDYIKENALRELGGEAVFTDEDRILASMLFVGELNVEHLITEIQVLGLENFSMAQFYMGILWQRFKESGSSDWNDFLKDVKL